MVKREVFPPQSLREVAGRFAPQPGCSHCRSQRDNCQKNQWDEIHINDGDTIELVSFVGGG